MEKSKVAQLKLIAEQTRRDVLDMIYRANSGHMGGSLSACELVTVLYFDKLRADPKNPADPDRDRFFMSKGHGCPAHYSALARRGYFPRELLSTLRDIDSPLSGHPDMKALPGIDFSSGSLGQGLSAGVGMAMAGKLDKKDYRVYVMLGDGEIEEGQVWEAAMSAANFGLDNLCAIVDNNNIQIDGTIEEIMSPYPIDKKFEAFRWNVITCDGHDVEAIAAALDKAAETKGAPTVIIAKTVKGKGISFMEHSNIWHGNDVSDEDYRIGGAELDARIAAAEKEVK